LELEGSNRRFAIPFFRGTIYHSFLSIMKNQRPMKIFCALVIALLALGPGLSPTEARTKTDANTPNFNREGIEAGKAGNWDKAIEDFKRAAEAEPNRRDINENLALAYRQRGLAEMKKKNWDGAISDFTECLKRKEGDMLARRYRASAYLQKGDSQNALEDYNTLLKEKKDDVEALGGRAFVEVQLKDYDKALADYSSMLKKDSRNVEAYLGRSHVYEVTEKPDLGLADIEAILKIQPTNQDALNRKKRLEAQKTRGQPAVAVTPVLIGTPIPRAGGQPSPADAKPSPLASPTASPIASPR